MQESTDDAGRTAVTMLVPNDGFVPYLKRIADDTRSSASAGCRAAVDFAQKCKRKSAVLFVVNHMHTWMDRATADDVLRSAASERLVRARRVYAPTAGDDDASSRRYREMMAEMQIMREFAAALALHRRVKTQRGDEQCQTSADSDARLLTPPPPHDPPTPKRRAWAERHERGPMRCAASSRDAILAVADAACASSANGAAAMTPDAEKRREIAEFLADAFAQACCAVLRAGLAAMISRARSVRSERQHAPEAFRARLESRPSTASLVAEARRVGALMRYTDAETACMEYNSALSTCIDKVKRGDVLGDDERQVYAAVMPRAGEIVAVAESAAQRVAQAKKRREELSLAAVTSACDPVVRLGDIMFAVRTGSVHSPQWFQSSVEAAAELAADAKRRRRQQQQYHQNVAVTC